MNAARILFIIALILMSTVMAEAALAWIKKRNLKVGKKRNDL